MRIHSGAIALLLILPATLLGTSGFARADSWDDTIKKAQKTEQKNETDEERERRLEREQRDRAAERPRGFSVFAGAGAIHAAKSRVLKDPTVAFALGPGWLFQTSEGTALQVRLSVFAAPEGKYTRTNSYIPYGTTYLAFLSETRGVFLFGSYLDINFHFVDTTMWYLGAGAYVGALQGGGDLTGQFGACLEGGMRLGRRREFEIGLRSMDGFGGSDFTGMHFLTAAWFPRF